MRALENVEMMNHIGRFEGSDLLMVFIAFFVVIWCLFIVLFAVYRSGSIKRNSFLNIKMSFNSIIVELSFRMGETNRGAQEIVGKVRR